ncbi:MAG: hypothetical protein P1V51_22400 [Deltaproteobacteria bacterium]|nr:hypothetical protein [Deltaproteobacteria bacterium]
MPHVPRHPDLEQGLDEPVPTAQPDFGALFDFDAEPPPAAPTVAAELPAVEPPGDAGGPDFGALFDELQAGDATDLKAKKRLLDWRIAHPSMDPDKAGEVLRLTASLTASGAKIDPSFVADNIDRIKARAFEQPLDTEQLAREHPALAAFLASPEGAAGADDVGSLQRLSETARDLDLVSSESLVDDLHRTVSGILRIDSEWIPSEQAEGVDWLLRAPRDVLGDKAREQEMIYAGFRAMRGWGSPAEEEYAKALFRRLQRTHGADGWLEKAWAGISDWGSEIAVDLGVRAVGGVVGGKVGAGIGALGGSAAAPGPGTVAGGGGGAVVGAAVGQFTSDFAWSYYQTAGSLYTQVLVEAEAKGLEVDRQKVVDAVDKGSMAIAGMFSLSFGKVLGRVPGVREVYGKVMKRAVKDALEAGTVRRAGGRTLTRLATNYALVGGIMGTQAAGQRATSEFALEEGSPGYKADYSTVDDAFVAGAVDAMIGFGFLGLAGPTVDLRTDLRRLGDVQARAERIEAAVAAVKDSKLADRAPEAVQELYRSFQGEKPELDEVYFSTEDFDAHWKGQGLEPRVAAAELLGDGGKAYDEARATGSDLGVPVEIYLTRIARGEKASPLAELARLEDGGRSIVEERQWRSEMPERIRALAAIDVDKMEEGRRALYEKWKAQAVGAGVREDVADANARLVSAVFDQFAARLNEDATRRGDTAERTAEQIFDELADVAILGPGQERPASAEAVAAQAGILEQPALAETAVVEDQAGVTVGLRPGAFKDDPTAAPFLPRPGVEPDLTAIQRTAVQVFESQPFLDLVRDITGAETTTAHPIHGSWQFVPERSIALRGLTEEQAKLLSPWLGVAFAQEAMVLDRPTRGQRAGRAGFLVGWEDRHLTEADIARIGKAFKAANLDFSTTVDGAAFKLVHFGEPDGLADFSDRIAAVAAAEGMRFWSYRSKSELQGAETYSLRSRHGDEDAQGAARDRGGPAGPSDLFGRLVAHVLVPYARAAGDAGYDFDAGRFARRFGLDDAQRALIEERLRAAEPSRLEQSAAPDIDTVFPDLGAGVLRFEQPAFHGTAATEVARIDLGKVGSGTGLAAEGWGFYATELEAIAELYREAAEERAGVDGDGQVLRLDIPEDTDLLDSRAAVSAQRPEHITALRKAGLVETRDGDLWVTAGILEQPASETTAKELYRAIADQWLMGVGALRGIEASRPDEAASRFLSSIGILGIHYPAELAPGGVPGRNFVVWDEAGISILDRLHQEETTVGDSRGYIEFAAKEGAAPRKFNIRILETADESTLAHETAHFLIEVMGDIVSLDESPDAIRSDYATLLQWMGYESSEARRPALQERRQLSGRRDLSADEVSRLGELDAREERLSRGFEGYLAEGRAPSPELAGVFARFRGWMLRIYRGLVGIERQYREQFGQDLGLNDTVRGVFDRLLASSVEVEAARRAADQGIFAPAFERMTPEQQGLYTRLDQDARDEAQAELLRRITESQRRENKAWLRAEKRRIREEIEAKLDDEPAYRAIKALQAGEVPGREGSVKLDRKAVEAAIGVEGRRALPRGVTAPRGGVHPDAVAALLGFDDGDALIAAMREAEPRRERVDRETTAELEATYGKELLEDPEALAEAALASVHSDKAALKVLLEMRSLVGDLKGEARRSSAADLGVLQDNVRRMLSDKQLRQISPGRYLRSERAAAARALEAALEGDLHRAYAEKEAQLLNMLLYRGAKEIREMSGVAERRLKRMRKQSRRARLGRAAPLYRDAVDGLLAAVGLGPAPATPVSMEALLSQLERDAVGVERVEDPVTGESRLEAQFDADLIAGVLRAPKRWSHLTPREAQAISEAVAVVDAVAKVTTEVEVDGRRIARAQWLGEAAATAARNLPKAKPLELSRAREEASVLQRARRFLENADGLLLEMETMITMLDGGDLDGPFRKAILEPYRKARFKEGELAAQYLEQLVAQWEQMPAELARRAGESVDLTTALPVPKALSARANRHIRPRSDLWVIALNLGNAGNRQRLLDGYGWTEAQVMAVLDEHLTREEWEWVQAVWDSLESLYPEVARVHEEDTGLPLGKVEATEVETRHGTFRGGYFPAVYDSRLSGLGTKQEESPATVAGVLGGSFTRPATAKSHTKGRAAQVKDYLLLDWSVLPSHVGQVVHDIAFRAYLKQTASLFLDGRFQAILAERLGDQRAKQWIPWLQAVAAGTASAVPSNQKEVYRTIRGMRNRSAIAIIGWSLPVALGDFTNPLMAAAGGLVSLRHLTPALARAANPFGFLKMRQFVLEHSEEVAHRARQDETSLVHQLEVIGGKEVQLGPAKQFIRGIQESAFALMRWTDALTTTPTWWAAYQQAMQERRVAVIEGKLDEATAHREAAEAADFVIGRLFPSHEPGERSAILNDRGFLGSLLMFHSYMNKMYNLQRLTAHDAVTAWQDPGTTSYGKLGATAKATGLLLAQWVVFGAAGELLSGRGPEQGEEDWEWALRKVLSAPFSTMPFVGQGVEQAIGAALTGSRPRPSIRAAPGLAVIDTVIRNWDRMKREDDPEKALFDLFEIVGVVMGLPTNQVRRTGRFLASGEADPSRPGEFASGVIYGQRPRQPENIFTLED